MAKLLARGWLAAALVIGTLVCGGPARASDPNDAAAPTGQAVDVELVLAVDVSLSVNDERFALQMQGYANAFRDPRVIDAVGRLALGGIAVTLAQWSAYGNYEQTVPWMLVRDRSSAAEFAAAVAHVRRMPGSATSLSGAIDYSLKLFPQNGYTGARRVIDISGDGSNNNGRDAAKARDEALAQDIVINGLPILTEEPGLLDWYKANVVGGPGAFTIPAATFEDFGEAIVTKLVAEIARRETGPRRTELAEAVAPPRSPAYSAGAAW